MRVLAWLAGGVAALVAALVLFILFVMDWNWVAGPLAERLGQRLGRGVAVDGPVQVHWGKVTRVQLDGVRLGNPPWAKRPDMARIASVRVAVRLWPLLTGRVELPELAFVQPDVDLEKNAAGEANWQFNRAAQAAKPERRASFPIIESLVIEKGRLAYADPRQGIDIQSTIDTATGGDPAHAQMHLEGQGSFKGEDARLELVGGSLLQLKDESKPYPLRVRASIGQTRASVDGHMDNPLTFQGVDLQVNLSGPDMAAIFPVFGVPLPATRPYAIEGRLLREGNSWTFRDFSGRVGESDLRGGISLVSGGTRPVLRANLVSDRLALADLGGFIGATPGGETETKAPDRVLPNHPVNLDKLRSMDVEASFRGTQVEAPGLPIDALEAKLSIKDGVARLQPIAFTVAQGSFAGEAVLDGSGSVPQARLDMGVKQVDLQRFFAETRFAPETRGVLAGRLELRGQGASTAEVLAGADGRATLAMAGGSFSRLIVEAAGLQVAEALGLVLTKDQPVAVRCLVADFAIRGGVAASRTLVLDTDAAVVDGRGTIDLATEVLDLRVEAHPKDPSLFSARAPVQVRGRLKSPDLGVEAGTEIARGGAAAALGALLTPLAALLPFLEPGLGEDQDCAGLMRQARGR